MSTTQVRQFRIVTTTLTSAAVLSHFVAVPFQAGFNEMLGAALWLPLIGIAPIVVFHYLVKDSRAILVCGSILLLTMLPAWVIPWFQRENPFAFFYAMFLAVPLSLVVCIMGARRK